MRHVRVLAISLLVIGAMLVAPTAAFASANDNFASATAIGSLPFSDSGNTSTDTRESGETAPCGFNIGHTVWYTFTPAAAVTVTANTSGSNYDTMLVAWTGSAIGSLTNVTCNDDFGGTLQSQISFSAVAGTTYRIQLGGYNNTSGNFNLSATGGGGGGACSGGPAGNCLASANVIASIPSTSSVNTTTATIEAGENNPSCSFGGAPTGHTVWYDFTPSANTHLLADLSGSAFDTLIGVYTGSAFPLTEVACDDDSGPGLTSATDWAATAGTTYHIQVGGWNGDSGSAVLVLSEALPPPNDHRANATVIGSTPYSDSSVNTLLATLEAGETQPSCSTGGVIVTNTVWYRYTPALPNILTADTFGSDFDTVVAVYADLPVLGAVEVSCNDDEGSPLPNSLQSSTTFLALPTITYYIQVGGWGGSTGNLTLNLSGILAGGARPVQVPAPSKAAIVKGDPVKEIN